MSRENLEIAMRLNSLFNAGEFDAAFELCDPDIEFRDLQHAPDVPEAVRGAEALRAVLTHWSDSFADLRAEAVDYVDPDPWVIARVRWLGKGRGSEIVIDARQADALRLQDGKVVEWIIGYPDMAAAVADHGLEVEVSSPRSATAPDPRL
jgi:ketosteroid isomerase-like protein